MLSPAIIAIIGAGTMGRRLAFDFARAGHSVVLHDAADGAAASALQWLATTMREWALQERLDAGTAGASMKRVRLAESPADAVAGADFVFENVPEQLPLKRAVFAALAPLLDRDAIIVSNTSSLPGSLMADASGRPDRFINANFSHLGHQKVEVMPHPGTSARSGEQVVTLLRDCGFIPIVLQREQFGYASNRVWRAVKQEVLRQLAAGVASPQDLDRGWMLDWEVPIGPCGLMDAIGLDVVRDIEASYAHASGEASDRPPEFLDRMVREGRLGVKSGEGFYRYPDPEFSRPEFLAGG